MLNTVCNRRAGKIIASACTPHNLPCVLPWQRWPEQGAQPRECLERSDHRGSRCRRRLLRRFIQGLGPVDSLTLGGVVHGFPKIAAPLHVQPEVGAVAEHPRKDQRRRGSDVAAVVAQLVDVLALHPHRLGQRRLGQPQGPHELLDQNLAHSRRRAFGYQHGSPHLKSSRLFRNPSWDSVRLYGTEGKTILTHVGKGWRHQRLSTLTIHVVSCIIEPMQSRTNIALVAAEKESITNFHDHMVALVRALGLHRPDETPCGQPIPVAEAQAVLELSREPGLSQNGLAARLRLEKSTVSRIVTLLERRGWVERRRDQSDARIVHVRLTTSGRKTAATLAASRAAKFTKVLEAIPESERESVTSALATLIEVIREV